jgi:16S rRNA (cytosine967-C5)-methyltransferase
MAVSAARSVAFEILRRVGRDNSYASELLHSDSLSNLSQRDHGLATELVMGSLRWQSLLDQRLAAASSQKLDRLDGEVLVALRLGAYQLQSSRPRRDLRECRTRQSSAKALRRAVC